jgi:hypothetical protein
MMSDMSHRFDAFLRDAGDHRTGAISVASMSNYSISARIALVHSSRAKMPIFNDD